MLSLYEGVALSMGVSYPGGAGRINEGGPAPTMGRTLPLRVCAVLSEAGGASLVRLLVVGASGVHGRGGAGQDVLQALEALVPLDLSGVVGFLSLAFPRGTQLVQRVLEVIEAALSRAP